MEQLAADMAAIKYAQEQQDLRVVWKNQRLLQAVLVGLRDAGVLSADSYIPLQILRARFPEAATLNDLPQQALKQILFAIDSYCDDKYDEWPSWAVLTVTVYNARQSKTFSSTTEPSVHVTVSDVYAMCRKLSSVPPCRNVFRVTASYRRTFHKCRLSIEVHCA